jgi:hypothetical protein
MTHVFAGQRVARGGAMRPLAHRILLAAIIAASVLVPITASAVTIDQIVALTRAGVTDAVILALIDRDKTIFSIEPEQLVSLKSAGVSEPVILAMLKSGREEGDRAAQAASDLTAALIMAERSPGPEVLVPSRGPEVNGPYSNGFYVGSAPGYFASGPFIINGGGSRRRTRYYTPPVSAPYVPPFTMPFRENIGPPPAITPVVPTIAPSIPPVAPQRDTPAQARMLCRAEVNTATSSQPLTFVTVCPPAMQERR